MSRCEEMKTWLEGKSILLLGFGREGRSTFRWLRSMLPESGLAVADRDDQALKELRGDERVTLFHGPDYLSAVAGYDIVFRTPGLPMSILKKIVDPEKITSQTDIFLRLFSRQVIGVTGTKGKSTTSTLIHEIIKSSGNHTLLAGNIGVPPFEIMDRIKPGTWVVLELSSHQLEQIRTGPAISVILNLYQEHLDHHSDFLSYQEAKFNLVRNMNQYGTLIYNLDDLLVSRHAEEKVPEKQRFGFTYLGFPDSGVCFSNGNVLVRHLGQALAKYPVDSRQSLPGIHNVYNIMASVAATWTAEISGIGVSETVNSFRGLPHRMENIGTFGGITFYNDSISTVPESTMMAIKSIRGIHTLILGGKDRGVDYSGLISFVASSEIPVVICTGETGIRIFKALTGEKNWSGNCYMASGYDEITLLIREHTLPGGICLLSPAASSYDMFRNFQERGDRFRQIALQMKGV
ncbi:MAG: UDP-N-acetylmuramoyl-L-alanine--D-glutamate ligase [Bacteroidales bacterium]|nr:UDP-N-acetylmuramoyl-L-alanine--D-glutamate ligase [Bacteroidales bacterium]